MGADFEYDVFLSHNSADKPAVRRLAKRLRKAGLAVWLDEWIVKPGDDVYLAIEQGLESSRTLVLCMSPAAFGSDWVSLERSTALFRDPTNQARRFVPLLLADCEIPDAIRRYRYIDYRKASKRAFEELLAACRREPETPAAKAPKAKKAPVRRKKPRGEAKPLAVLERKLTGHKGWVLSVAVSPDSKWAASASEDRTVKIWDLETGECRATLEGHAGIVWSVAITPDGERILSGSDDSDIRVWDARSGGVLRRWGISNERIGSIAILPEGRSALSCGGDNELRLWDLESEECVRTFRAHTGEVWSVAVTGDGERAVSGSFDKTIKLWDIETGERLATLRGHTADVNSVQITRDGRHAVSGSEDMTVKIWGLEAGACIGTLEGHESGVDSVDISSDGRLVASTGFTDHTVRLWDRESGACVQVIEHQRAISPASVAFSPDGQRLVVGAATSESIYVYRLSDVTATAAVEATRRYVNAKVVLVGESGVGKSGLAHRLIEDEFVQTHSTHGMQVWRLDLPIDAHETLEREALLWDLAGQEDYRLIHQLFLDETALALVLINPQKDDPFAEAVDWLKALDAANVGWAAPTKSSKPADGGHGPPYREAPKLLIAARTDVGAIKVSQRKIDRFLKEHRFAGYLETSAKTGKACSDGRRRGRPSELKGLIARHIPWDRQPWTSTPALLADIKNAVLKMTEKEDIRLLRFGELCQRLGQTLADHQFGASEVRTAVTLLANHGSVQPLKFGDLVLLRPDLLNGYGGAVVRAARAHVDEIGCVREEDVYGESFDWEGVERLARPDEELLLRAMVQTFLDKALCIAEQTSDGRHLVFPSQYRRERPFPSDPEVFVSYTFTGELATIYTTLVVRLWYSREFDNKELWQNAAEFLTTKGQTVGLLMDRSGEGEGTIGIFFDAAVPDELRVVFIEYVHQHLHKYARGVQRDRRYVCPSRKCAKPVTDQAAVREQLEAGEAFIYCQRCGQRVPLIDHIEQRLKADPVARRVAEMDEKAGLELDKQALEQTLTGHMMAICGEANQTYRPLSMADYGIDGEVAFRGNDGKPSGQRIYVQLKSGDSHLSLCEGGDAPVFRIEDRRHIKCWQTQPCDVWLVIRHEETIRWMNVTRYLKERRNNRSRQIVFNGETLDAAAVWRVRDEYIPR